MKFLILLLLSHLVFASGEVFSREMFAKLTTNHRHYMKGGLYWSDPLSWIDQSIPKQNQSVLLDFSLFQQTPAADSFRIIRILEDEHPIHIRRLVFKTNSQEKDMVIIDAELLVYEMEIEENVMVVVRNSVKCSTSERCQIRVKGELVLCQTFSSLTAPSVELIGNGSLKMVSSQSTPYFNRHKKCSLESILNAALVQEESILPVEESDIDDEVFGKPFTIHEISIIIPSTHHVSQPLSLGEHKEIVERVVRSMVDLAGGATTMPGSVGYWMDNTGVLIKEEITIVTINMAVLNTRIKQTLLSIAKNLAREMDQEAIFLKINQKAYLIE